MLDRQAILQRLSQLDWSQGFTREKLLTALLAHNIALPNEFLSAIPPLQVFQNPEQLIQSVPEVVWTIHAERETRARGHVEIPEAKERTRKVQVQ